jgi:hypothetical protein
VPTDTCHTYDVESWSHGIAYSSGGSWTDVVVHVRFSKSSDGVLEAWVNGEQQADYAGELGYNDEKGPYFTFGSY